jgi:FkbM family methyltransferase
VRLERGLNGFKQLLSVHEIEFIAPVLFDVGANVGDFTHRFLKLFPDAVTKSFEPTNETFRSLSARFSNYENVVCENMALGAHPKRAWIELEKNSSLNRVLTNRDETKHIQEISITTGDDYVSRYKIEEIDFLKIDTEGHDLEVLKGFDQFIGNNSVLFIQVEVGINPENEGHIPLEVMKPYLEERNFKLYYMHEFAWLIKKRSSYLKRVDAIFVDTRKFAS